jgi:hypothetical protein
MKQTIEKTASDASRQDSELDFDPSQQGCESASHSVFSASSRRHRRPEVAVLDWNIRSYRLSLRGNKV